MKPVLLFSLLLFATTAFGKKAIETNSKWTPDNSFPVKTDAFDKKSEISLGITNDDKNIYLTFVTSNRDIQMAVMKQGFKFYLDTVKQKNKECYLSYANEAPKPMQPGNRQGQQGMQQGNRQGMGQGMGQDMEMENNANRPIQQQSDNNNMIPPFRKETMKGDFSMAECNEISYELKLQKTVFSASFELDTAGVMICRAVIPLRIINPYELKAIHNLSIGLEIESSTQQGPGGMAQGGQQGGGGGMSMGGGPGGGGGGMGMGGGPGGGGGGMSMGGGPGGGGGGMGMGGGPSGSGGPQQSSSSSAKKLAKFWVHTNLAHHP